MKTYYGYYINGSGYSDPTAGAACMNVDRERSTLEPDKHRKTSRKHYTKPE